MSFIFFIYFWRLPENKENKENKFLFSLIYTSWALGKVDKEK